MARRSSARVGRPEPDSPVQGAPGLPLRRPYAPLLLHRGRKSGAERFVVVEAVDREDADTVLIASGFGAASQSYRQRPHSRFRAELFLTRCAARCVQPASASPNTANPAATRWPRSRRTRQRILSASGFRNRPTTHHQWRMWCGQPTSTDHRSTRSSTISATYRRVDVFQGERWSGLVRAPCSPLRQGTSCCVVASFGWRGSWREVGIRRRRQTFG